MLPRHPNFLWEQLAADELLASIIVDGHHLPAATVKSMIRAKTPRRVVLVTDAIAAAGQPPGDYQLGALTVTLDPNGRVAVPAANLAGSALSMDRAIANTVKFAGVTLDDALAMVSRSPAEYWGCSRGGADLNGSLRRTRLPSNKSEPIDSSGLTPRASLSTPLRRTPERKPRAPPGRPRVDARERAVLPHAAERAHRLDREQHLARQGRPVMLAKPLDGQRLEEEHRFGLPAEQDPMCDCVRFGFVEARPINAATLSLGHTGQPASGIGRHVRVVAVGALRHRMRRPYSALNPREQHRVAAIEIGRHVRYVDTGVIVHTLDGLRLPGPV